MHKLLITGSPIFNHQSIEGRSIQIDAHRIWIAVSNQECIQRDVPQIFQIVSLNGFSGVVTTMDFWMHNQSLSDIQNKYQDESLVIIKQFSKTWIKTSRWVHEEHKMHYYQFLYTAIESNIIMDPWGGRPKIALLPYPLIYLNQT